MQTAVIYLWDHITAKAVHPALEDDNTQKPELDDSGLVVPINVYLCLQVFYPYLWVFPLGRCVIKLSCADCRSAISCSLCLCSELCELYSIVWRLLNMTLRCQGSLQIRKRKEDMGENVTHKMILLRFKKNNFTDTDNEVILFF